MNARIDYYNAVDPVTAGAEAVSNIAKIFSGQVRTAKINASAQADQDRTALRLKLLESKNKPGNKLSTNAIIGIAAGGIVIIGVIIFVAIR
jgi:hypothetical protein